AVPGEHADRVGNRVEQRAVALALGRGDRDRDLQRIGGLLQQVALVLRQGLVRQRPEQHREALLGIRGGGGRRRRRGQVLVHVVSACLPSSIAWVTLLPLARPSWAASQRPVSTSFSRSMPVSIPMPCSM